MLVLDVGCGWVRDAHKRRGEIGLDLHRGYCDIIGDAQHLPFRDGIFDAILLYSILEHLDNPLQCLRESRRVARNGAHFEIVIPIEARGYIKDLKRMVLEFPFGLLTVMDRCWSKYKQGKMWMPHKNLIQPYHISRFLKVEKVEIFGGIHSWFVGRKGKLFRMLFKNPPKIGVNKNWYVQANKA